MTLNLPPEIERHVNNLIEQGQYSSAEAVVVDAVKSLVREQERRRIESSLDAEALDLGRLNILLQEAADSGDYVEMTAKDWQDIEREGLAILNARKAR